MIKVKEVKTEEVIKVKLFSGEDGKSAYELAKQQGFIGTLEEWLESLKGKDAEITDKDIQEIINRMSANGFVKDENYNHTDNNYTNADKEKLIGLSNYDDTDIQNYIDSLQEIVVEHDNDISNIDIELDNINEKIEEKANKNEIPNVSEFITKNVDNLVNYYLKNDTYTKQETNQLIGAIKTISMKLVPERPQTGQANIIYLVPNKDTKIENIYDEYIYVNDTWELIGSTSVDLSNVLTKEEYQNLKNNYVKDGLVNNNIELTDEEQIKIEDWLGLSNNYLTYYNSIPYVVEGQYVPAHKKYVDDKIGNIDTLLINLDTGKRGVVYGN